jgi:hypothetical protein
MTPFYIGLMVGLTVVPCLFLVGLGVWVVLMRGAR